MNAILRALCSTVLIFVILLSEATADLKPDPNCANAVKKTAAYQPMNMPLTGAAGQAQSGELYWVTFSGDCSCDQIWVMQIDALGNIIKAPKAVLSLSQYGGGASALGKNGTSKLNLWHWKGSTLMRAIIDKSTLNVTAKANTPISSYEDDFVQVSQNASNNLLLVEAPLGTLKAFALQSTGMPSVAGKLVTPSLSSENDEANISADGLALVANRGSDPTNTSIPEKVYFQLLDQDGAAKGQPTLLASFKDIEAVDVTSALNEGKRFVVYTVDAGTTPDDKLFLQVVNASGQKVGAAKTINIPPNRDEDNQTVGIDPHGKFVLLTMDGQNYGCAGDDILMYQGLTDAGAKKGSPKVLIGCNFTSNDIKNIDLLKE